jgi:hypothetical protein
MGTALQSGRFAMRLTHLYSAVIIGGLSFLGLVWIIPSQTAPPESPLDLPPAFMPMLMVTICLLLSIVLGVGALRQQGDDTKPNEEFGEDATGIGRTELLNFALWAGVATMTWMLLRFVGFEPAMTVFLLVVLTFAGVRQIWLIACVALIVPIALAQFTWYALTIQVPGFWR